MARRDLEGAPALALCEAVLLGAMMLSTLVYSSRTVARAVAQEQARTTLAAAATPAADAKPATIPVVAPPTPQTADTPLGVLVIPRLGLDGVIKDGIDEETLDVAIGRIPGTGGTPASGNIALAAHRDTFFRPLRHVREQDVIRLQTADGEFEYVVTGLLVVDPEDVWVLDPTERPTLTLVTCYPFTWVGSAPRRFIVRAERRPDPPPQVTAGG
jgi:LPXTG-site transpeptidase (sortase) family protein